MSGDDLLDMRVPLFPFTLDEVVEEEGFRGVLDVGALSGLLAHCD